MTRFIHDQFAKDYLETLLSTIGKVESPKRVAGEARQIDVAFIPTPNSDNIDALGLLGKMATTAAIFEPFRNPVTTSSRNSKFKIQSSKLQFPFLNFAFLIFNWSVATVVATVGTGNSTEKRD